MADTLVNNIVHYCHPNDTDTLYGLVFAADGANVGKVRDITNSQWDTFPSGSLDNHDISAGTATGGLWIGSFPNLTACPAGFYIYQIRIRSGATPDSSDVIVAAEKGYWNGTILATLSIDATGRVDVGKWLGTACVTPDVNGVPVIDVKYWGGRLCQQDGSLSAEAKFKSWVVQNNAGEAVIFRSTSPGNHGFQIQGSGSGNALDLIAGASGKSINSTDILDAIKTKTDNLPTDPADDSDIDSQLSTLDGKLDTIGGYIDTEIASILAAVDTEVASILEDTNELQGLIADSKIAAQVKGMDANVITASALNADAVDEIHDEVVEGTITLRQAIKLFLSALTGKSSGGGTTTLTFRDIGDTKNRLQVTVDSRGNRTAVGTRDGT